MDSDMQRAYQKNLVIGNLITVGFAAIVALGLVVISGVDRPAGEEYTRGVDELIRGDTVREGGNGSLAGLGGFHGEFITSLRVISDEQVVAGHVAFPVNSIAYENLDPIVVDSAPGVGDGTGSGFGTGDGDYGLPEFSSMPASASPKPAFPLLDRQETIRRLPADRKLYINGFKVPRLPHKAANTKGVATVEVEIKSSGAVGSICVIKEEPRGFGFGEALINSLNECVYYP